MTEKKKKEESQKISRKKRLLVKKVFFLRPRPKIFPWLLLIAIIHVSGFFLWNKLSQVQIENKWLPKDYSAAPAGSCLTDNNPF